jgi:predicted RNA-binding Zn ribbon-like protein
MDWKEDDFVGLHPALDFLNTVSGPDKSRTRNRLTSAGDLKLWWSNLPQKPVARLPSIASTDLPEIIGFRELAFVVFSEMALGHRPRKTDLSVLSEWLKRVRTATQLCWDDGVLKFQLEPEQPLDVFLWMVDDLLRHEDLSRLSLCDRCSWLFLDKGRGKPRRWCSMATCGNRHKVARYREKRV